MKKKFGVIVIIILLIIAIYIFSLHSLYYSWVENSVFSRDLCGFFVIEQPLSSEEGEEEKRR